MRPIIGISTAWSNETWEDDNITEDFCFVGCNYIRAIYNYGAIPLLLAPIIQHVNMEEIVSEIMDNIDGLLLSGGGDVGLNSKKNYEGKQYLKKQQYQRYEFESLLIKEAWKRDLPVLGICRGHQMIAEVLGGNITEEPIKGHSGGYTHKIKIMPSSILAKITGLNSYDVNSYHSQVIYKMPDSFNIGAISGDGKIEEIESKSKRFFMGVQFHPEMLEQNDKFASSIFKRFIENAMLR